MSRTHFYPFSRRCPLAWECKLDKLCLEHFLKEISTEAMQLEKTTNTNDDTISQATSNFMAANVQILIGKDAIVSDSGDEDIISQFDGVEVIVGNYLDEYKSQDEGDDPDDDYL